jgi:hypothetical protein
MDFGFTTALDVVADARELSAALAESLAELQARCAPAPRARVRARRAAAA